MGPLLREIRHTPLLWMLVFVPIVLVAAKMVPAAHTLLFVLAVLAIVPLAALLSHATEAVFIYVIFAMTLYMVPPGSHGPA